MVGNRTALTGHIDHEGVDARWGDNTAKPIVGSEVEGNGMAARLGVAAGYVGWYPGAESAGAGANVGDITLGGGGVARSAGRCAVALNQRGGSPTWPTRSNWAARGNGAEVIAAPGSGTAAALILEAI